MENAGGTEEVAGGGFHIVDSVLDLTRSPILSPRSSSCNQFGGLGNVVAGGGGYAGDGRLSMDSSALSMEKTGDDKMLRRLAQNREAARKSRIRKKAYVQNLESSRLKLMQLEQELQRARQQGMLMQSGYMGNHGLSVGGNGALAFDIEYAKWLDEHHNQINDLRLALNSQADDEEVRLLVDSLMAHHDVIFKLKSIGTRSDVFHMLSGLWTTPAERCFMWLGGFRSSELLKVNLNDSSTFFMSILLCMPRAAITVRPIYLKSSF
ncbi:hypothetical protein KSP40_PGU007061 [Platanthera guangdongensis]|uniref:Uncharacterized protein n=1 Tax=Platanthera guangdongensis TaxID=2320717 RepID=A0ABR2LKH2_9ASPA